MHAVLDSAFAVHGHFGHLEGITVLAIAACFDFALQKLAELALQVRQLNAILRALRSGHAGLHIGQVQLQLAAEFDLTFLRDTEHALSDEVVLEGLAEFLAATCAAQVIDALFIDREEAHGRAILGSHVRDGRAVGQWKANSTRAVEFDEFSDDAMFAKHLGAMQCQVRGGHAFAKCAREVNANDFRNEERYWLTQHPRFGFNTANTPSNHAEAIDHRRMGICAHEGIWVKDAAFFDHALGEIFEVHLVHNADAWRHDFEGVEGLLTPFEELVAFFVTLKFQREILIQSRLRSRKINLHRVIDDQIHWHEGFDHFWIFAHLRHSRAHGSEVHEKRHASEILKNDACYGEGNFIFARILRVPVREVLHIRFGHLQAITVPHEGFQHDADADREFGDRADALFFKFR